MRIGEAARRLGINPRTLRYYERIGLLPHPKRTASGYRAYSAHDIERVKFIRRAQMLQLSLGEIQEIVAFRDRGVPPCSYVRTLLDQKRQEVQSRMAALRELQALLDGLTERAATLPPGGPEETQGICHLIEVSLIESLVDLRKPPPGSKHMV